ncbi:ANTAR domain-containing response regulator [Thermobrachium celere]|uniref:Stage 0 sporulation protein A homolog n=1 Tax=Thermobrachium celere DSM 8682 TaxID=941824 RepID=R7RS06_9CLOT|nr:ANTAR domain-containing protein [Thermobrachium celere]CDF58982.1 response regulator receiver and ANTAR domain protein [Thermobrachium celere DSM 8682]
MDRLKVAVGDNDEEVLKSIQIMLVQMGCNVVALETSGSALLRKIRSLNPDVSIIDVNLRGMSAFEISDVVEKQGICPCIITIKGSIDEYYDKLKDKLVFAYLQKPINAFNLRYAIESAYFNYKNLINMDKKLKERKIIDKAKGLIMKKYNLTEERAYEYIRKKSMDKGVSMARIAQAIIDIIEDKDKKVGGDVDEKD